MTTSGSPAPENCRALALAVQQDFRALLNAIDEATHGGASTIGVASIRAAAERGLKLSIELLDSMDDAGGN